MHEQERDVIKLMVFYEEVVPLFKKDMAKLERRLERLERAKVSSPVKKESEKMPKEVLISILTSITAILLGLMDYLNNK